MVALTLGTAPAPPDVVVTTPHRNNGLRGKKLPTPRRLRPEKLLSRVLLSVSTGASTSAEIASRLGITPNQASARLGELARDGLIRFVALKPRRIGSGRAAHVYELAL